MAELKTKPTRASVAKFIAGVEDEVKRLLDVDLAQLEVLVRDSVDPLRRAYPDPAAG